MWNYKPQAVSLADEIKEGLEEVSVEIVEGSGGVFEVTVDGSLVYSKKETGRFPEPDEIVNSIKESDWYRLVQFVSKIQLWIAGIIVMSLLITR